MKKLVLGLVVMLGVFVNDASAQLYLEIRSNALYQDISTWDMPYEVRNVKMYPDDHYNPKNIYAIQKFEYRMKTNLSVDIGVGYKISKHFRVALYMIVNAISADDRAFRNYSNAVGTDQRGEGAALTFCELNKTYLLGSILKGDHVLDVLPEFSYQIDYPFGLSANVAISYCQINAANGWDRWDKQEYKDTYVFAYCIPITGKMFWRFYSEGSVSMYLYTGLSFLNAFKTDLGRWSGLENQVGYLFGLAAIFSPDTKK